MSRHLEAKNVIKNRITDLVAEQIKVHNQITELLIQKEELDALVQNLTESLQVLSKDDGE